jgi:putative membrane-bound dehydrogenase-like protein
MTFRLSLAVLLFPALILAGDSGVHAQGKKEVIPYGQSQPPGPPLAPDEAIKKMQVPDGFRVELVAAEPDLVNPIAMTFDEKGRIWITESTEYPRHSPGPGKDRVKLFESTRGDGKYDKVTTVIDGLNIPSGIAVGHGGVWVANSPDILFYPFEDRDRPKLGKPQVVVTGFGRADTHELPNSLTWGPDGYLYGLNGVFNPSVVRQDGKEWRFTCAMFRIHPRTKKFDVFCEGTSNPWGIAFDPEGSAFVSACVIDHLWHLVETGYYHRQGGPYPPYTWKIESIVKHKHQKAAYCGLHYFDSDAYPPEYRGKLYMGNIHGNCINCDELTRDGSSYFAKPRPDFLTANDAWFMPVAQRTGPDGCLYILDWYDRYHCYQDAGRDPAGIDRLRGRLYRVVYKDYRAAGTFDLSKESDEQLIERLQSPNVFYRDLAQRIFCERFSVSGSDWLQRRAKLWKLVRNEKLPLAGRTHALWALVSTTRYGEEIYFIDGLLQSKEPWQRAWGVRTVANNMERLKTRQFIAARLARDPSPDVQLQVAIAARKLGIDPMPVLLDVLTHCGDDKLIPHIVWQNLHPLLEKEGERFLALAAKADLAKAPGLAKVLPRGIDCILGNPRGDPAMVAGLIDTLAMTPESEATAKLCLSALTAKVQTGELAGKQLESFKKAMQPTVAKLVDVKTSNALRTETLLLGASLGDMQCVYPVRGMFVKPGDDRLRVRALQSLIAARDTDLPVVVSRVLTDSFNKNTPALKGEVLQALGRADGDWVAKTVLGEYRTLEPEVQPRAIELLTQRPTWAKSLFKEIAAKKVSKDAVNINQARRLLAIKDAELNKLVCDHWGAPRDGRNPEREKVVAEMRELLKKAPGNAHAGIAIFKKVCAQCHKIYGEGTDVGPDITSNGRSDFEQLLSNVFDPSLVIGAGYQATTVVMTTGQVITGVVVEDNRQRLALKMQGGEVATIPRDSIDEMHVSKVSLMPEGLERQLQPQEIADLFAFLCLDRPPDDPKARKIPGTPR